MSNRSFIIASIFAVSTLIIAAIINFLADPYGLFRIVDKEGFNQQKEGVRSKIRFVKALELPLRSPATIVIGSSRVHDAINPEHPALQEFAPVYNYGVDMLRVREALYFLKHATLNSDIKRVVFGLDFFMFNSLQRTNNDFDSQLIGRSINYIDYLGTPIFSKAALLDSVKTVKGSVSQPNRREFLPNGFRPNAFWGVKNYEALHYYTNWIFLTSRVQNTKYYQNMELDPSVFDDFEEIIRFCRNKGIDLRIYISPAHANLDGEGIRALGKLEMLEYWKTRVTEIADKYDVTVWDFSGYNSVTTEIVRTPMKYYWDSSHFTELVSDLILKRLFNTGAVPHDFGIRLTPSNINQSLAASRVNREAYYAKNFKEIQELQSDYKEIIRGAPLNLNRVKDMF